MAENGVLCELFSTQIPCYEVCGHEHLPREMGRYELPIVAGSNQASAIKLLLRKEAPQTIQPSEFVILFVKGISGLRYLLPFLVDAPGG